MLWDFSRTNKQKLSANVAISLHSLFHQSVLPIQSCGVTLISSSQLFSFFNKKGLLGIALQGSMLNFFSMFICLMISCSISEEMVASEK